MVKPSIGPEQDPGGLRQVERPEVLDPDDWPTPDVHDPGGADERIEGEGVDGPAVVIEVEWSVDVGVGDVITASSVITPDGARFQSDEGWLFIIEKAVGARRVEIVGSSKVAATVEDKAALLRFGAAVDMESHVAAQAAKAAGLPFAVLRVISDGSEDVLPPAALAGMGEDGDIDVMAVLSRLAANPRQLSALMRTGRNAGRAFRRLEDARKMLSSAE